MKRILSITLALLTLVTMLCTAAFADGAEPLTVDVYVTIADKGTLALTYEKIGATDRNGDNTVSIDEAFYAAHEAKYNGGAAAGYASAESQWGLSMNMLWGDTSGAFGYYVNNASVMGLADAVNAGDHIYGFVYADSATWSDVYSYFDLNTTTLEKGSALTLTLFSAGYDAEWNPVVLPVEGATIIVDGVRTACKTDAEGKVSFCLNMVGDALITATSDTMTLVPPVCVVTLEEKETQSGADGSDVPNDETDNKGNAASGCQSSAAVGGVMLAMLAGYAALAIDPRKRK